MSVNFEKTGIIRADGVVGANLIKRSNEIQLGGHSTGLSTSLLDDGTYQVVVESASNGNWTTGRPIDLSGIEDSLAEDEVFTVSLTIRSADNTKAPIIYLKDGIGYYQMLGTVDSKWSTVYYSGTWKKANTINPHLGWAYTGIGTYQIKNWKIEKGSSPTPWCPNETDDIYVGSTAGFIEEERIPSIGKAGYVQATEFIEW